VTSAPVEQIANAVLYEGYLLYPYRASAVKNRQRWNFGVVYPRAYSIRQNGCDPCEMQTQCLATGGPLSSVEVKVRFLRMIDRISATSGESWQEASEGTIVLPILRFAELEAAPFRRLFALAPGRSEDAAGIVRTQQPLDGCVTVSAALIQDNLYRITVIIANETAIDAEASREAALARSLLSAHTILRTTGAGFVSLLEPPAEYQDAAAACKNIGTWPVLAGDAPACDTLLSSPIILYDYPQVAPESPGDLFDGAEIDEILSLRILTLTDEEKAAMRSGDDRARRILERTESLPPEHFLKLHGVLRSLHPVDKESS
jgi:hydrogenase maturation protease